MSFASEVAVQSRASSLAFRYALRELRGGLRGFYVFIACIALGVMAISGVGSVAASLGDGLSREGRTLLGGDVAFSLISREAKPDEVAYLRTRGEVSIAATLRAMARSSVGKLALVELKAVDGRYPMLGELTLEPNMPVADLLAERDGVFGAAADSTLLARLDLKLGDRVSIGSATYQIRSVVVAEPDKLAGGVGLGPRFLISEASLRATDLLQPGSLVRWIYRVKLPDGANDDRATTALIDGARAAAPEAGWEVRSRSNASPQLERTINRFTQFLTLVGLAALLVGGVGVANAVKSHIDRRRDVIASFKALGATGRDVFTIYCTQVVVLAGIGSVIGLVLGAALPFVIVGLFGKLLPLPVVPALHPDELALSFIYGQLTALAFGLWPLGRVHDVPVAALFRETVASEWHRPRWSYLALMAVVVALLIGVAIGLAYDKRIATVFVAASIAVFLLLRGIAEILMAVARRLPRSRMTMLRLAIANIHRPGALTPSVVLSLGLGLAVLVTITQIDGNLRRQFLAALPERAPSFFFIDIPSTEAGRFAAFLGQIAPGSTVEDVPMLRGRIVAARGVKADQLKPSVDSEWVLQSDRGLTYTGEIPKGSKIVEGEWWGPDYSGPPLVSMEKKIADGLGLKIGDEIVVNVLGRDVPAKIANLRNIDWQGLGINFVLVFSPNAFKGAPHSHVATLTEPHASSTQASSTDDARIIKQVADTFPMVTSVRVREALETVGSVVSNLVLAIRGASAVTLISAILVLGGALAAGHRHRVYDAVILKTLGATRVRLLGAYALEYLMIGFATAIFGVIAGSVAAWLIVTRLMTLSFIWQAGSAAAVVVAALVVTVGLGLAGTLLALNQKPASVLRNL
ncbi:ABC transporter permease [Bradyrhizobium viridifuturi]|jgi:putative ABC transport system permease protein|uniref:ABC transporter permease n=4 Tax=Nitrobacteraceae TaxID=41294 RepID=UPI000396D0B7|nr:MULTISPECIES: ABC transporter permease [Bradyrhizobium]ERF82059.1 MAG: ABC transporter permease [Bradyrhizobium sp. DFCI-1]OYU59606.1 MAG: ABC transporter permease [Bradyrhizobium sp. PARBB1]PSO23948.1 ABC transporter permease [Bradyrhizobium sp. MOS004]QRI69487.1 ABC transporter permease [Bradyrhizobium sp. PSBB068]MBR1022179.1 ABC transporter permease [Bradyrhizobium viridifuturi]